MFLETKKLQAQIQKDMNDRMVKKGLIIDLIYRGKFGRYLNRQAIETIKFFNEFNFILSNCLQMQMLRDLLILR